MATLKLWKNFSKRKNSTKLPSGTADASLTVRLKEDTSLEQPTFILTGDNQDYNYAEYAGHYYYIDDIVSVHNGLSELRCTQDCLATYKTAIKASSQYVLYYDHNNTEITDRRLSTKTTEVIQVNTDTFFNLGGGESYLVTAVGSEGTSVFACDKANVDDIFTNTFLTAVQTAYENEVANLRADVLAVATNPSDVGESIKKLLAVMTDIWLFNGRVISQVNYSRDASQFLKNCYVLPIAPANIGGTSAPIRLGSWNSNSSGNKGFSRMFHDSATVAIPWQATDWRKNAPYHSIYLYIPYIGLVNISPAEVIGVNNITVNVAVDTYSGVASFVVNADNNTVLGQYSTNIASPYAIGSSNIDIVGAGCQLVSSATSVAGGAVTGNAGAITGGALGLVNVLKQLDNSLSSNGGAAGMGLGNTVKCFTVFHDTTVSPSSVSAVKGTPYNGVMSLSSITGYVQCAGASVPMAGLGNDKDIVNNYLNGGVYIE